MQRVHSDEFLNCGFRQVTLCVENTVVLNHQENGGEFLRCGEQTGISGISVHQSCRLVVYIPVNQLFAEKVVLFRRSDFITWKTMRQRTERCVRKTHRLVEILRQKFFHRLHGDGFHHVFQQEKVQIAVFVLLLFQLAMGDFVSDGVGVVFAQIEVIGHLNVEMFGLVSPQIPFVAHDGFVKRDK